MRNILRNQLTNCEIRVFGSRVTGGGSKFSDLDQALVGSAPMSISQLEQLHEAFSRSNLPILVDIVDWQVINPEFRKIIVKHFEILFP